jgi:hypothetical protein
MYLHLQNDGLARTCILKTFFSVTFIVLYEIASITRQGSKNPLCSDKYVKFLSFPIVRVTQCLSMSAYVCWHFQKSDIYVDLQSQGKSDACPQGPKHL